jgi:hypothetical protein
MSISVFCNLLAGIVSHQNKLDLKSAEKYEMLEHTISRIQFFSSAIIGAQFAV